MVRRTDPKEDEWQNVTDAKKRKQIQDRLAQRARRQRLREAKTTTDSHPIQPKTCDCDPSTHTSVRKLHHRGPRALTPEFDSTDSTLTMTFDIIDPALESFISSQKDLLDIDFDLPLSPPPLLSPQSQPAPPVTVFTAMYLNGQMLGLSCSICITSRSPFPAPHHPPALRPTQTQLLTPHPRWYDRFPFPRMRDTLIRLVGVIDEEELIRDFFTMPSWRIEGGENASWEPGSWIMEKEWRNKWGWLMI
ncbi:hypothetical protein DE146DRAFT_233990 [Phaeosphaeria sp. MPI-PUGE-AT-0046c]|nr:hypothetical protein DE146DRAFT_233990 [Phaeosphaeria sp. MPI-PUGE-AT-0046c]